MQVLYLVGLVWGEVQFIYLINDPSLATFALATYNLLYTVYCTLAYIFSINKGLPYICCP
jgi:hypothetical protein